MVRRLATRLVLVSERSETAVNQKPPMMPRELKRSNQFSVNHCVMSPILTWEGQMTLAVRNVALGVDQEIARQADNPLIRATASRRRQLPRRIRHVDADHGEVAIVELPNVRATPAGGGFRSAGVRVGAEAFDESHTAN